MAVLVALTEVTPYRLTYSVVVSGEELPSTVSGFIPNANGITPDLRTDSGIWIGSPIYNLVRTPVLTNDAARRVLNGDGLTSVVSIETVRAHIKLTPVISSLANNQYWSVDAAEGSTVDVASTGFPVVIFTAPGFNEAAAVIDIDFQHTYDR